MKKGFYLSPCGRHVLQVSESRYNVHTGHFIVIDMDDDSHCEFSGFMVQNNLEVFLSCWEYLGE